MIDNEPGTESAASGIEELNMTDPRTQMTAEPILVTTKDAMKMLSLGRSSIVNLANSGDLTPIHLGRSLRFSTADISALVERRKAAAEAAGLFRLSPPDPAA